MLLLKKILKINLDVPTPWGIYFQDSATPQMEGLVELHDDIHNDSRVKEPNSGDTLKL